MNIQLSQAKVEGYGVMGLMVNWGLISGTQYNSLTILK